MGKEIRKAKVVAVPRLAQINLDALCHIFSYLDLQSISRLEQTCRSLHFIVNQYGWRAKALQKRINTNRREIIPSQTFFQSQSPSIPDYKRLLQVDQAWSSKTFRSYQFPLPSVKTSSSGKADRHQPQSLLLLTPLGLLLFTGCEMRLWTKSQLRRLEPIQLKQAQLFHLINPVGWGETSSSMSSALWDICSCTQLDNLGHYIAIGRLNGFVEIIHISKRPSYSNKKGTSMQVNLLWLCNFASSDEATATSVQSMHACPSSGLFAIAYKNGQIRLYKIHLQLVKFNMVLISAWKIDHRPWSIWLEKDSWLAVGINSDEPIIVYSLHKVTQHPTTMIKLSTGGAYQKTISVYALQSQTRETVTYLLAGCYDGTLRLYDIDNALKNWNSTFEKTAPCFQPLRQIRDRFDPSAIYCLCNGVGPDALQIAAGTSRYGVCKFFQLDQSLYSNGTTDEKEESWSAFAAYPSQSPTYSLVGQFDRLFGITDAVFWQIDTRNSFIPLKKNNVDSVHRQTLAFYRHEDMVLERSRWPVE